LPEEDLKARGFAASLLSYALYWSGDLGAATQASAEAIALSRAAGDSHVAVNTLCELTRLQILQGQLHKAVNTCREALQLAEEYADRGRHRLPITGHIYAHLSHVLYEWNELEAALHHAREGLELCRQWGQAKALIFGYASLARALQASGDADGALDAIREARQFMHKVSPWYEAAVKAQQAHLWLAQGDVAAASRWVQESRLDIDKGLSFPRDHEYLTLARVLIAQGRRRPERVGDPVGSLNEALGLLVRLLRLEEAAGAMGRIIEILVLQAMALQAQSEGDQALAALERALTLAEPEGYVRIFIDEGAPMAALLRTAASRGIAVDYVGKLLAAFGEAAPPSLPLPSPSLIEPLSERELEVLRLLAAGLSNREIAAELFLAVGTVKKHTSNIYGKLNVSKRTQAVVRARELSLL
jgi:LuxR family maltose regulon positive regulatory protein